MKFFYLLSALFLFGCTAQNKSFQTLEYEATACFGFCPIFEMTINPDRTAVIKAERFTFSNPQSKDYDPNAAPEGTFKTTLSEESFKAVQLALAKLDLNSIDEHYGNRQVTDLPTAKVKIELSPRQTAKWDDYGKNGTPELRDFYKTLEELRFSEDWVKID